MDKFNELLSKFKKSLINIKEKMIKFLKKINLEKVKNNFEKCLGKLKRLRNFFYDKIKVADEIVWILIPCLLTLFIVLMLGSGSQGEVYSIITNEGDKTYYEGNYDLAINEYNLIQQNEAWPIYSLEVSNIYSIKQDFEKSKSILKESIIIRDRINKENKEKGNLDNKQADENFINKILFIFNMNKEYDETMGLGEQYLIENGLSNKIIKNLYTAYLMQNHIYKAEELLKMFTVEENSAINRAELANMKGLLGDFDGAIELLKEAVNIDPNEILIYDTIEELFVFDSKMLIETLESKNTSEYAYKLLLTKAYSISNSESEINKAKELYLELKKDNKENYILSLIAYSIYNDIEYLEESYKETENKEGYISSYIKALYEYKASNLKAAENEAYKSITLKADYDKSYTLLADIMNNSADNKGTESYLREALEIKPYSYKVIIKTENFYSNIVIDQIKARYYLDMEINIKKDDGELYYKLVKLDLNSEDYENALLNINRSINISPENNNYHRSLGAINFKLENYEDGIESTRYAYDLNGNDVLSLNNAAWFYINVEKDVFRGYENIKSALDDMPLSISEENKKIIMENYNRIKSLSENGTEDYVNLDLKLIY